MAASTTKEAMMRDGMVSAGFVAPGEYVPSGEAQGIVRTFGLDELAAAFGVPAERVAAAMQGEFGLAIGARVPSAQAQELAEALLTDAPLDAREAALMSLGAFTPRPDHSWGVGEAAPSEESDKVEDNTGDATQPIL